MKTSKSAVGSPKRTAKPKTAIAKSGETPQEYLDAIADPDRRRDMTELHGLIRKVAPDLEPYMDHGFIGYGMYHYKYASGCEGDASVIGLSSRAAYMSLYVCATDGKQYIAEKYKQKLAKADIGRSCVRFKHLSDLDPKALVELIREGATALVKA